MSFTHLQVRSGYSLFNSTIQIEQLVQRAVELKYNCIALTDEEVLYAVIPFYKACVQNNIKPIVGMVVNILVEENCIPCILLAKTNRGYKHLIEISTYIQLEGECPVLYLKDRTTDLICIVPSEKTAVKSLLLHHSFEQLTTYLDPISTLFSKEDFYVGLEIFITEEKDALVKQAKQFATYADIKFVALHDVRYIMKNDAVSYDCLQAMKQSKKWDGKEIDPSHLERHMRTKLEINSMYSEWVEIVDETEHIAKRCNVTFSFDKQLLPTFPVPDGTSAQSYVRKLCMKQLPLKYEHVTDKVIERLDHELTIIEQLGFSDYFLIVADFVQYAKKKQILVGPGRGSAAGSIVSYLLGITNVDPLSYDLLFERFLNPERITMPDIDIDFSDVRREEVIDYIRNKYGKDRVAQIITFGTFAARSLIRELMKTMEINEYDQAYILKQIPPNTNMSIVESVKASTDFQNYIKQSKRLSLLFFIADKLEGLPRHISTHAAGIVIGSRPLIHDVPLTRGSHETYLTQYAMGELEAIGLLKIDILGLRNLTLMERVVQSIKRWNKEDINIDFIPKQDKKTFKLLQSGHTNGIFQLESAGMKRVLLELNPTSLEDIIALNALYRPGPMENIPTYMKRKHGHEKVTYLHSDLEPILQKTYGVLIYQEQIMQIANQFAGLSLGEADILRRAISKKDRQLIQEQRETFVNGCVKNGYTADVAEEVFSWIVKFANYGFNKSHSVAYSKIAYQLAYLKANYPTSFFAQLLSSVSNESSNKLMMYVREVSELGIEILAPSINKSKAYYVVENNKIRMGLLSIKGIGYETVKEILHARKTGQFSDLFDFCLRVNIKRNALETLILAGTFDEIYPNRASLLASVDQAMERVELFGSVSGQSSLFSEQIEMKPAYIHMDDFTLMQKLKDEKELLHIYVTNHPLKQYRRKLSLEKFCSLHHAKTLSHHNLIKVIAIIQQMKKIRTKRGDSMAFVTLSDETDEMEGVIFPTVYRQVSAWLKEEEIVYIEGKISIRQNKKQIIINQLSRFNLDEIQKHSGYLYIKMTEYNHKGALVFLKNIAKKYPGNSVVIVYNEKDNKSYKLSEKYMMEVHDNCLKQLKSHFGSKNVVFKS